MMEVPQPVKRSVDVNPNFLCDNSTYILGIDERESPPEHGNAIVPARICTIDY